VFAMSVGIFAALLATAAPAPAATPPLKYFPKAEWRRATPQSQGVRPEAIEPLVERLRSNEIPDLHSLLVVRNGYLVVEEYFNGSGAAQEHTLQSVTKSVTSLLVGVASQKKLLDDVDRPALDFFPEYQPVQNLDDRKAAMTVRDVLTMRTGFDWVELGNPASPLPSLNQCHCDWMRFMLDWPMAHDPGTHWEYNTGASVLLGGVLRSATGRPVWEFARQELFNPIGVQGGFWYVDDSLTFAHTGGGLNLRAQDMARIGYLVLRNGKWGKRQLVSPQWLRDSMRHASEDVQSYGGQVLDYGYQWWQLPLPPALVKPGQPTDIYTAIGRYDQWIFVVPRFDLVVVVTGGTSTTWAQPIEFLYRDILPALR
jgi:CubicO group peptidase (beta-lactamase class C family)